MMNAKAAGLGLARTHFARPDGLDARAHYSTALDVTRLAEIAMRDPRIRAVVRERTASISGGRKLHTWNDLLGVFGGLYGVKTGHTSAAGWCQVAAVKRNGVTLYTTVLGSPTRSQRNSDLAGLLRWAVSRYRQAWVVQPQHVYLKAAVGYGKDDLPLIAVRGAAGPVRVDRPLVERVVAPAALSLPVTRGQRLGEVRVYSGKRLVARPAHSSRSAPSHVRARRTRRLLRVADVPSHRELVLLIVTVTLNAAIDRTLTVPNFQLGQRHRASQGLTLAGGKGINVARALKRLDVRS
jgi:D-alanyl-D-alanine carboxypeptidase (penicillin-binding protein 5/6)